jgi:hypothetical protein
VFGALRGVAREPCCVCACVLRPSEARAGPFGVALKVLIHSQTLYKVLCTSLWVRVPVQVLGGAGVMDPLTTTWLVDQLVERPTSARDDHSRV